MMFRKIKHGLLLIVLMCILWFVIRGLPFLLLWCGFITQFWLRPPLGQLLLYDWLANVGHSFPTTLLALTLASWLLDPSRWLLHAPSCLLHLVTLFKSLRSDQPQGLALASHWDAPPLLRVLPLSPLPGFVPFLRRAVVLDANISYYPPQTPSAPAPSSRCRLDVWYRPPSTTGCHRPVLLYIHGGAWNMGHRRINADTALLLSLAEQGWVVVSLSYRFTRVGAGHAPFPACLCDCAQAARWASQNAKAYGGAGGQLAVMGGSAGGHLALLLAAHLNAPHPHADLECEGGRPEAVMPPPPPDIRVTRCVALYPVSDPRDAARAGVCFPITVPGLGKLAARGAPVFRWFFGLAVLHTDEAESALWDAADPSAQVGAHLPPVLVVHGTHDSIVPIEHSREFLRRLRLARGHDDPSKAPGEVRDRLLELPGARHSAGMFLTAETTRMHQTVREWLSAGV